jgi:2-polyprenyl-6-methoxyphenol hydroxylase-like FAD-dependent oxidoreductase
MTQLKVLIVGGGITGPALAHWLSKLDCNITIMERAPDLRASGQQVDLRGEGVAVMRKMGIESAVRAKVVQEEGTEFVDKNGRRQAYFEANKTGKGRQSLTSEFEIMRGDLVRILYDLTRDKCTYIFGNSVEQLVQTGNGVHVKFSDGSEDDFDLVVGADGQSSRTRRKAWGPDAKDPFRFLQLYLAYFTVPKGEQDNMIAKVFNMPGRRVIATRVDNPRTMQVYLGYLEKGGHAMEDALRSGDVKKQKQLWADMYKDAGWEAPRLIHAMLNSPEANDFYFQKIGQVKMDKWSRGRVVLVGDAGYTPSPLTGKGTSIGLIGAYVLAGELARHLESSKDTGQAVDAALESYEKVLRPCVEKAQELFKGVPGIAYPETEWGVWFLHLVVRIFSTLRIVKLIERFSSDNFAGDWKLPDYPELQYQ